MKYGIFAILLLISSIVFSQTGGLQIALLKYNGGGDWYANPTSLPNLADFCNKNLGTHISTDIPAVDVGSSEIFNYPFLHMTGHGNVVWSAQDQQNLRTYLIGGGFLHIDDNYGMEKFIRPQIAKLFPEAQLVEIPFDHPIFHQKYEFKNGLPKIHEHDGKPPQALGIFLEGRLVLVFTYECDLGDGWEDPEVHKDSKETRLKALQMGANLVQFAFTQ